jgi:hypothetical protein
MNIIFIRICDGCGNEFPNLEKQLDGKDYCNTDCFMDYNSPCEDCGEIVPNGDGVHYKEEGYTLCWKCACGNNEPQYNGTETTAKMNECEETKPLEQIKERVNLYEKNRQAVYATGNKWVIENWNATH